VENNSQVKAQKMQRKLVSQNERFLKEKKRLRAQVKREQARCEDPEKKIQRLIHYAVRKALSVDPDGYP